MRLLLVEDELALDTVVDKLKHGSLHIALDGESYRRKKNQTRTVDSDRVPVEIVKH